MTRQRLLVLAIILGGRLAAAQTPATSPPPDVLLPDLVPASPSGAEAALPESELIAKTELDIASTVLSTAKGTTTVQEAPSIVTIVTADEIRKRGFRYFRQILENIPGWLYVSAEGNQAETPVVRGVAQGVLYLRDGVSLFDPVFNIPTTSRVVPLETIKRVELVTGPGGVLWGANSFLGVLNVINKDAEDVNGLELGGGYGAGPGDPNAVRVYGMYGKSFLNGRIKLFAHASFESFRSPSYRLPELIATSPAPQPSGPLFFGRNTVNAIGDRGWLVNLDGKLSLGPINIYYQVPFGTFPRSVGFANVPLARSFQLDPVTGQPILEPISTRNPWNFYERYVFVEYHNRFAKNRVGINAKGFYIQFNRDFTSRVFPSSAVVPGGLTFQVSDLRIQRFGATFDLDYSGPWRWNRVLAGFEVFNESLSQARTSFPSPAPDQLPLVCPLTSASPTYVFASGCPLVFLDGTERTVLGIFFADQIRPTSKLTLDGGIRYQQGFGRRRYAAQPIGSASLVWQFYKDLHIKLNWSQGFRPPVFNNTDANGAAVAFAGNPRLSVERSSAYQGEFNARLLRDKASVRELQLRIDYSYTLLQNVIVVESSAYRNSGRRAYHSVEFLGKLYLKGDHLVTLGYTFLSGRSSDSGQLRNFPNHWFSLGAVISVIKDRLSLNANLNVLGAYEDPNRFSVAGFTLPDGTAATVARFSDLTYDRLTPVAQLQLGVQAELVKKHLSASVQLFNLFNQRYYYLDIFNDQTPTLEPQPTPAPGFSLFASLVYRL